jgi:hypothetical protein
MTARHTPAPWHVGSDTSGDALTIWSAQPGTVIGVAFDDSVRRDAPPLMEAHANARLMSAAPEIYEALRGMVDNSGNVASIWMSKALAALAKAEGVRS